MKNERQHCLEVAEDWLGKGLDPAAFSRPSLADLIARERAAARAEALDEAEWAVIAVYDDEPLGNGVTRAILVDAMRAIRDLKESK